MMDVPPVALVARGLDKFASCFRNASMLQRKAALHTSRTSSNCVGPWTLDSHKALYIVQSIQFILHYGYQISTTSNPTDKTQGDVAVMCFISFHESMSHLVMNEPNR